jgi:hypothetical protein
LRRRMSRASSPSPSAAAAAAATAAAAAAANADVRAGLAVTLSGEVSVAAGLSP